MAKTGIFARLRRRRWALCLSLGYALLLNALLVSVTDTQALAAAPLAIAAASLCGDPTPHDTQHHGQHQSECPLCGPACPMGGSMPLQGMAGGIAATSPTRSGASLANGTLPSQNAVPRSLYLSDMRAQAPPAA